MYRTGFAAGYLAEIGSRSKFGSDKEWTEVRIVAVYN